MRNNSLIDINQVPKELKLILNLITDKTIGEKDVEEIDWNLFIKQAMHHRLFPLLYIKLSESEVNRVPSNVVGFLESQYKENTYEMLRLSAEMDFVNKLCIDHHIPLLFLKGPVLAADLYGDLSLRTSCDLDILIPIKDLEKLEKKLLENGYQKQDYILSVLGDWKWRHHHITFIHSDRKIKLEVHWRLNPGPSLEPSFDELWGRKRVSNILNKPIYYLGREDLFLFLVSHGSRHGWSRLRWLTDIDQLLHQNIDWVSLFEELRKYQLLQIGGQAIILSSELLNTPITKDMKGLINSEKPKKLAQQAVFYLTQMISLHSEEPLPLEVSEYHKHHLFSLMSIKQKVLFLTSFVHPYYTDFETLPLPKIFHFLYFPLRPFLCLWRKAKAKNHAM